VLANYNDVLENKELGLRLVQKSVEEIQRQDFSTIVGMVENRETVDKWITKFNHWWDNE